VNTLLLGKVVFPFYHIVKKTKLMEILDELKENQWKSKEALIRLQGIKLKRLLEYTYRHVPYYREKFKETGIDIGDLHHPECFPQIPLLTKKDINEYGDKIITTMKGKNKLLPYSTSGSTGEALYFNYDLRSSVYRRASVIRNQEWLGIKIGDRSARLWGAPMDLKKASEVRGRIHSWINNIMFLSSYDMSNETLETYVIKLNKFKPELLISYPGPLTVFAEYLIESNQKIPSINAIISSAETLLAWQRDLVEKAFSCSVYNRYGCREFGDIAQECEKREGLHVNIDRVFLEVLDEALQPVKDGRSGELVITDLDNYGMPFIRYQIGDVASFKKETCSCGRGLPLLDHVEGRILDVVKAPNGNRLGGTFWTILFKSRPGIKSFQVVQDRLEGITVKYIKYPEVSSIDFAALRDRIQEKCGEDFKIDFEEVFSIPKTSSGKTRIVISKLKDLG
jgi:phenylacetate-coenzyme A ligase PaaK-like adenylate-forming protein